ncbi:hemolysin family protein [Pseudactinotalea sp.]|uniref:hemolysin family protein n=1 Tax=Pseudactinotalea sp. TaxID=1926260 RepID=UPI003B3B8C6F
MVWLTLALGVVVIALIIAANFFFVAQEFAYMSVDRSRLRAAAAAGDKGAERALKITQRNSFMLSGAQLGITVTGLLLGFVAEPLVGDSLGELLGGVGIPAAVGVSVGTVLALGLSTIVQMVFAELYPKNLAIAIPEKMARWLARPTRVYLILFGWLITVFDHSANLVLRLVRVEPVHDLDSSATARDLERIVADSRDAGNLPSELSVVLDRILDFPQQDVEHAMIPRSRVDVVSPDTTVAQVRELMARAHTRYPVVDEHEEALGVVQLADVLGTDLPDDAPVTQLMREPLVLPTLMSLPDALAQLTQTKNELACVIDEYGGFTGVLTVEDLAEEIIGQINDEHDGAEGGEALDQGADGSWTMDGDVHVDEAQRAIGHELPRGDYETVAGLVIAHRGELPEEGEKVTVTLPLEAADLVSDEEIARFADLEILAVERHVPAKVRVTLRDEVGHPVPADGDESVSDDQPAPVVGSPEDDR